MYFGLSQAQPFAQIQHWHLKTQTCVTEDIIVWFLLRNSKKDFTHDCSDSCSDHSNRICSSSRKDVVNPYYKEKQEFYNQGSGADQPVETQ